MSLHGKWSQAGVPHDGWTCTDIWDNFEDDGELSFMCQMCESQKIRYVHEMVHPLYQETLSCGCICAGNMEGDPAAAIERERQARQFTAQRDRWPNRKGWSQSTQGNPYLRYQRFVIVVYPLSHMWPTHFGFLIKDRWTNQELVRSRKPLPSEFAARRRTYDAVQWLAEQENLRRGMNGPKPP